MSNKKWQWEDVEVQNMSEHAKAGDSDIWKSIDDEPGAHKEHRRISRYGRSHQRFQQTMKGRK